MAFTDTQLDNLKARLTEYTNELLEQTLSVAQTGYITEDRAIKNTTLGHKSYTFACNNRSDWEAIIYWVQKEQEHRNYQMDSQSLEDNDALHIL